MNALHATNFQTFAAAGGYEEASNWHGFKFPSHFFSITFVVMDIKVIFSFLTSPHYFSASYNELHNTLMKEEIHLGSDLHKYHLLIGYKSLLK